MHQISQVVAKVRLLTEPVLDAPGVGSMSATAPARESAGICSFSLPIS